MVHEPPLNGENLYYYYRVQAAKLNADLKSRDNASEMLGISTDSLKAYESGKTAVPAKIILKMCKTYNAPELHSSYCKKYCPIGEKYSPAINVQNLEIDRLTIQLLNSFRSISNVKESLLQIVADGEITPDERPILDDILNTLDDISLRTQELRVWVDKYLGEEPSKSK